MKRTHKEYFVLYLKENIIIFDVFNCIEELAAEYVDFCYEWNIVKNDKVKESPLMYKRFLKRKFYTLFSDILYNDKKLNDYKIFSYYKEKDILNKWSRFFNNPVVFIKIAKRYFKTNFMNFIEINEQCELFQNVKGYYDNIPCLMPSGEDENYLLKYIKKLK